MTTRPTPSIRGIPIKKLDILFPKSGSFSPFRGIVSLTMNNRIIVYFGINAGHHHESVPAVYRLNGITNIELGSRTNSQVATFLSAIITRCHLTVCKPKQSRAIVIIDDNKG